MNPVRIAALDSMGRLVWVTMYVPDDAIEAAPTMAEYDKVRGPASWQPPDFRAPRSSLGTKNIPKESQIGPTP